MSRAIPDNPVRTIGSFPWFPPFRCRSAVPFRPCRFHLPLRRNCRSVANRTESYFGPSAVGGQPISVLVSSSLCIRKDVSRISVLTCNGNGIATISERKNGNSTTARHNGTTKRQNGNGRMATQWWKLVTRHFSAVVDFYRAMLRLCRSNKCRLWVCDPCLYTDRPHLCCLPSVSEAVRGDACKSNGGCSENAWCVPVPGGRACRCKLGFVGNGISCTPVSKSQCRLYV